MPRAPASPRRYVRLALRGACACSLLQLGACQSVDVPKLPDTTPSHFRHAIAGAEEPSARTPDLTGWWHAFGDQDLDALVMLALDQNLTLAQAQSRLSAARAIAYASRSSFRPNLSTGTLTTPDPDAAVSYLQGNIDATWELGLFGRAEGTRRVAQAGVATASADLQGARVTLVAEVARDYLAMRGAQQQVAALERVAEAQRARRKLMAKRVGLGLATTADASRIDAEWAQSDAALAEPRARADAAAQQLAVLCGRMEPAPEWLVARAPPRLSSAPRAALPADLLRTRPDVRRAEAAVLAAAGEVGIARSDLYPRLSLFGAITSATTTSGGEFGFGRVVTAFGPSIDLPLFDWGARRARVDAKDAELAASVSGYRETVLEAVAETENALGSWNAQSARVVALRTALAAREREVHSANSGRRLGLADGLDEAAATIALEQGRLELMDAELSQSLAYIALYKALGGAPAPTEGS